MSMTKTPMTTSDLVRRAALSGGCREYESAAIGSVVSVMDDRIHDLEAYARRYARHDVDCPVPKAQWCTCGYASETKRVLGDRQ